MCWGFGLLLVLAAVAVWFAVNPAGTPGLGVGEDRAMRLLRERYARGEIGAEEFDERRRLLER